MGERPIMTEAERRLLEVAATHEFLVHALAPDSDRPAELIETLWLHRRYIEFVDADDDTRQLRFRITPAGRRALPQEPEP